MDRLILSLVLIAAFTGLGLLTTFLRTRAKDRKSFRKFSPVPSQLKAPKTLWAIVVFTADNCHTCPGILSLARKIESDQISVLEYEASRDRKIHRQYGIKDIPLSLLISQTGEVELWFFGPLDLGKIKSHIASAKKD